MLRPARPKLTTAVNGFQLEALAYEAPPCPNSSSPRAIYRWGVGSKVRC